MGKLSSSFKCSTSDFELTITYPEHPIDQFNWQGYFKKQFKAIGTFIGTHGIRISMHPGQFTLINSVNSEVFERSVKELLYHAQVLDLMELDMTAKI
jgi:UV DNA damage endonuclease